MPTQGGTQRRRAPTRTGRWAPVWWPPPSHSVSPDFRADYSLYASQPAPISSLPFCSASRAAFRVACLESATARFIGEACLLRKTQRSPTVRGLTRRTRLASIAVDSGSPTWLRRSCVCRRRALRHTPLPCWTRGLFLRGKTRVSFVGTSRVIPEVSELCAGARSTSSLRCALVDVPSVRVWVNLTWPSETISSPSMAAAVVYDLGFPSPLNRARWIPGTMLSFYNLPDWPDAYKGRHADDFQAAELGRCTRTGGIPPTASSTGDPEALCLSLRSSHLVRDSSSTTPPRLSVKCRWPVPSPWMRIPTERPRDHRRGVPVQVRTPTSVSP